MTEDDAILLLPPKNAGQYIALVERFSGLVDLEFKQVEAFEGKDKLHWVAQKLPALISMVNVIGQLRGEAFLDVRPKDLVETNVQGFLYKNEDFFEKRLNVLIKEVCESGENTYYLDRLEGYYLRARSLPLSYSSRLKRSFRKFLFALQGKKDQTIW